MRKMLVCFLASLVLWSVSCDNGTQRVPTDETALNDVDTPLADELVADDYTDAPITETGSDADEVAVVLPYPIVDTGQTHCYDDHTGIICPSTGAAYFGQDAQYIGNPPSYTVSNDGLTVLDNVTGLTWQRSPDTNGDGIIDASDKLTHEEALAWPATVNAASYGGFNDWRLPTIKEQYSLINFNGQDPSGLMSNDTSSITPFIDDTVFGFAYGDTAAGERIIDSQYASSNLYVDTTTVGDLLFGVNFADGRIKGYGLTMPNGDKKFFFVTLVRGNPDYGINDFEDNDDGTITDHATGLMWMKDDSGEGMNWAAALAYAQTKNAESYLGYNDWRLPHVKELQSILDYSRSPGTTGSAAIDPLFNATKIQNEACEDDYPWYWSGTTHAAYNGSGASGAYVCFGRALGYMQSTWIDIHGAGAQRSDPKGGSLSTNYTAQDCGYYNPIAPQGDGVRNSNFVRLVRSGEATFTTETDEPDNDNTPSDSDNVQPDADIPTGPTSCDIDDDCAVVGACPPGALMGCGCRETPSGDKVCMPLCENSDDCPVDMNGNAMICDNEICRPA